MNDAGKLLLFVVAIAAGFVYICNVIPQVKSEPVVEETVVGATPEELVAAGRRIFMSDRAQCLTCHSLEEDPKARCPNQEGLGARASERKPGMDGAAYLVESVYNPNAYVVSGYPRDQMQPVNKAPIALSHDEILAVTAYLNSLGGETDADFVERLRQEQEPWRRGLLKAEEGTDEFKPPIFEGKLEQGFESFRALGCIECHRIGSEGRDIGPDLTKIGASQSADYILDSVLNPSSVIVRGYKPTNVIWKQENARDLLGTPVAWVPDKDHPSTLLISVLEGYETTEVEVDLADVACVGDTIVIVKRDNVVSRLCGDYVSGDAETGATLAFLENGVWAERQIPGGEIQAVRQALSPMPSNFSEIAAPREIYGIVAFLLAQQGEQ